MRVFFQMPCVAKHIVHQSVLNYVPATSLKNLWLDPWQFNFDPTSKYGKSGRFPSNHQYKMHLPSFLTHGFESQREAIDVKFQICQQDSGLYKMPSWSVNFVDGQNKLLILQSVLAICMELVEILLAKWCDSLLVVPVL